MDGLEGDRAGELRARVANAMVTLQKEHFGRGPEAAKAWLMDDYVFVVLEGGLTRHEETLLAGGKADLVRELRLAYQATIAPVAKHAVGQLVGREVLTYHSQVTFDPVRSFEMFVLAPEDA